MGVGGRVNNNHDLNKKSQAQFPTFYHVEYEKFESVHIILRIEHGGLGVKLHMYSV